MLSYGDWILTIYVIDRGQLVPKEERHRQWDDDLRRDFQRMVTLALEQARGLPWELHYHHMLVADSTGYRNHHITPPATRPAARYGQTWGSLRGHDNE